MREHRVDISVITVAYECRELLRAMLASLEGASRGRSFEVIVVDNASSDGVVEMLRSEWPTVAVVEMGENAGFARANNRGLARARGRYVMLLNPDTVAHDGSLSALADFLGSDPRAAVAAPRLLYPDLSDQGTARSFPTAAAAVFGRRSLMTRLFPRNRWSRRYLSGRERSDLVPFEVDWVSGAAMMVRRDAIDRVGGLDERFFMHWEDADWCHRMKDAGYSVHCVPAARIVHHEGGSRRGWPPRQLRAFHSGAYRYYAKHHAPWWSPLRYVAAAGLAARAALLIVRYHLVPHDRRVVERVR
jgi:N-acetylglucosaminyl-diphospho-decaprenol L-rhamnosyltransferase